LVQRNHKIAAATIAFEISEEDHAPWPRVDGFLVAMRALHHMPIENQFDNVESGMIHSYEEQR